jgi:hypothetical protein
VRLLRCSLSSTTLSHEDDELVAPQGAETRNAQAHGGAAGRTYRALELVPLHAVRAVLSRLVCCHTALRLRKGAKNRHDLFNCELVPSRNRHAFSEQARSGSQPFHTELREEGERFETPSQSNATSV